MAKRNAAPADDTAISNVPAGELFIQLPEDFADLLAESQKPPLDEGKYLAVVLSVAPKTGQPKADGSSSYGLSWELLINTNPDSVVSGWDDEAKTFPYKHYSYIGKLVQGRLTETDKGSGTRDMGNALGLTGSFGISAVKFRQIVVEVTHVPSFQEQAAVAADPTYEVERYFVNVAKVRPYVVDGNKAPVLAKLADGVEPEAPAAPTGEAAASW